MSGHMGAVWVAISRFDLLRRYLETNFSFSRLKRRFSSSAGIQATIPRESTLGIFLLLAHPRTYRSLVQIQLALYLRSAGSRFRGKTNSLFAKFGIVFLS
jgi:hypothetical protein